MGTPVATTRRPNDAFDDHRLEQLCQGIAVGQSLAVAAASAGLHSSTAAKLRGNPEVLKRLAELQSKTATVTVVSKAWICSQLEKNVIESRADGQFKASNEALKLLAELIEDGGVLDGVGIPLPSGKKEMRDALKGYLSATSEPEPAAEAEE